MFDKLLYIPKNYPFCRFNWRLERLETKLNEPTHQNSILVPQTCKGNAKENDIVKLFINNPMNPTSLN